MKQMRSRFRLITLLLVCAFLMALALCTGTALKEAGVTLSSLPVPQIPGLSASPSPSVSPEDKAPGTPAPDSPEPNPFDSLFPWTDNSPDPEYNNFEVFGL